MTARSYGVILAMRAVFLPYVYRVDLPHVRRRHVKRMSRAMMPWRAREIIAGARALAVHGPWSDQIDRVLRPGEREAVWKATRRGCFVDTLYDIARCRVLA